MPKRKFALSKKHEYLIDKIIEIPEPWERTFGFKEYLNMGENAKNETIVILMQVIKKLTDNTALKDTAKEFLDKAQKVFDYVEQQNNRHNGVMSIH